MHATMAADPPVWPKPRRRGEGSTKAYNQDDATGFIRLNGLRLKVATKVHGKKK